MPWTIREAGFLNTVYERFFQGVLEKRSGHARDCSTPRSDRRLMVRSVEDVLQKEFGKSLSDEGVHILDPFVELATS